MTKTHETEDGADGAMRRGVHRCGAAALAMMIMAGPALPAWADAGHGHKGNMPGGRPGKAAAVSRTIRIVATDIAFDRKAIRVKAGETIRFVITNKGQQVHDFTLGTRKVQAAHRRSMLKMMNGGRDMSSMKHADPNAVLLKPSETKILIWRFAKARNFEFGCNVPGHYEAGMKGSIEIR